MVPALARRPPSRGSLLTETLRWTAAVPKAPEESSPFPAPSILLRSLPSSQRWVHASRIDDAILQIEARLDRIERRLRKIAWFVAALILILPVIAGILVFGTRL